MARAMRAIRPSNYTRFDALYGGPSTHHVLSLGATDGGFVNTTWVLPPSILSEIASVMLFGLPESRTLNSPWNMLSVHFERVASPIAAIMAFIPDAFFELLAGIAGVRDEAEPDPDALFRSISDKEIRAARSRLRYLRIHLMSLAEKFLPNFPLYISEMRNSSFYYEWICVYLILLIQSERFGLFVEPVKWNDSMKARLATLVPTPGLTAANTGTPNPTPSHPRASDASGVHPR
jgi:hypothetical protein